MEDIKAPRYFIQGDPVGVTAAELGKLGPEVQTSYVISWFLRYHASPTEDLQRLEEHDEVGSIVLDLWRPVYTVDDAVSGEFGNITSDDVRARAIAHLHELAKPDWERFLPGVIASKPHLWAPTRAHPDIVAKYGAGQKISSQAATVSVGQQPIFRAEDEQLVRDQISERASELIKLLMLIEPYSGIGHNHPPAEEEAPSEAVLLERELRLLAAETRVALRRLRAELAKPVPDPTVVGAERKALKTLRAWLLNKGDKAAESFASSLGKSLGATAGAASLLALFPKIALSLQEILVAIGHWFHVLLV